jgi:hypothetical protein
MLTGANNNSDQRSLERALNKFWYCPHDNNLLQIRQSRIAQTPYFIITRKNVEVGINNAISMKKIPPEAATYTRETVTFFFNQAPSKEYIDLVSVSCKVCGTWLAAPKLSQFEDLDVSKTRGVIAPVLRGHRCPNCSHSLDPDTNICPYCGCNIK